MDRGSVGLGVLSLQVGVIDGIKLRASASKHKAMNCERIQAAEVELKA